MKCSLFLRHQNTYAWEQRKVGEIGNYFYGGGTPNTQDASFWNGEIPWLQSSDLFEDKILGILPRKYISEAGLKNSATKLIPQNSITIVTRVGVGKVALITYPYTTSQDFLSISELNINELFGIYLISQLMKKENKSAQGTSIKGVTKNEVLDKSISIPSLEEQTAIGNFFRRLDEAIASHQRKFDKLKVFKKSMLQKMFPRDGKSFPELRFPNFTDPWEQRKLGEVVDVCSGRDYKHLSCGNIPVYGTGGYMLSVSEALSDTQDAIGIGRKGTIDKPYILKAPFWTVDTLFYAIPTNKNNLDFIYCIFQITNWKQKDESTGVPSLSKSTINSVAISSPTLKEQTAIGNFFRQLDEAIASHQRKIEQLQTLKKAFLQKMFV